MDKGTEDAKPSINSPPDTDNKKEGDIQNKGLAV